MKKYLFGALALLFAIAFTAFTTETKVKTNVTLFFHGDDGEYNIAEKWTTSEPSGGCQEGQDQICSIETTQSEETFKTNVVSYSTLVSVLSHQTELGIQNHGLREDF